MGLFKPNIKKMEANKDIGGLIKTLEDKDEKVVEPLIQALKDEDQFVQKAAREALENIKAKKK